MNTSKDHYKKFEELYGQLPSEVDRPSLASSSVTSEAKEADKKKLSIAAKVRDIIVCIDCKKPRCVYASATLSSDERKHLKHVLHSGIYTCGCELFPPALHDAVICRQALTCKDPMETQYYSSVCVSFPPVCWFCGCPEEMLADDEFVQNLRTEYAIVRPICFLCRSEDKRPATWGACNVAAKRSKK